MGASVLTNLLGQTAAELRPKIARYREARRRAGHAGEGHVTLMLHTFVGPDPDAVRATVRRPLLDYLRTCTDLVKRGRWGFPSFAQPGKDRAGDATGDAEAMDLAPDELDAMLAHAFERYFRTSGLFGTPDTCLATLEALEDIGVDEIACLVDFGAPREAVLEGLVHLGRLRERCAGAAAPPEPRGGVAEIARAIRRHGVTHLQCTPSLARVLAADDEALAALAPLRKLLVGGEVLPQALARTLAEAVTGDVLDMYGPTETTVWSTAARVGRHGEAVTIGRPLANTELYVLDPRGAPVPIGAAGELYIGGAGVARGYFGRPELTRDRFVASPFSEDPEARLYRTGDLVRYRDDGALEFVGRIDGQVKLRGHRIELGEIEAALGAHPAVDECAVALREDAPGRAELVAYVVPRAAHAPPEGLAPELRAHLAATLPPAMVPGVFVIQGALPRTPNGKLDRRALPPPDRPCAKGAAYAAPAGPAEEAIAAVWREILAVDRLGRSDNVFDLGANSLLVMQATSKLQRTLGRDVSLVEMFRFPTVSALATHLGAAPAEAQPSGEAEARARARSDGMERRRQLRAHPG
jgi:hypothetical protein